ncbi:MAG: helix-turn-helix domain-containing protein [Propionibacteriaceae bacterium]|nr:helix-turn-helix domain-containing protein [Propionibacteriaceae bacterium]
MNSTLFREHLGEVLRGLRLAQRRKLHDISTRAHVSLGYLSEVERGQKEASSEMLASIVDALDVRLSHVLRLVARNMERNQGIIPSPGVAAYNLAHAS